MNSSITIELSSCFEFFLEYSLIENTDKKNININIKINISKEKILK